VILKVCVSVTFYT